MAMIALSTCNVDRMDNELEYFQKAMKIVEKVLSEEEGGYEILTTEKWTGYSYGGSCKM